MVPFVETFIFLADLARECFKVPKFASYNHTEVQCLLIRYLGLLSYYVLLRKHDDPKQIFQTSQN